MTNTLHHNQPIITKASRVFGNTLTFRNVVPEDATFILSLRTNEEKSKYLNKTDNNVTSQIEWIKNYQNNHGQAYFIIEYNRDKIGTVRLYDAQGSSFCWGSWILIDGRPRQAAMESSLMVYSYAIDHLGFSECHFDVRKENNKVIAFHERFGAFVTRETEKDFYFKIDLKNIRESMAKYKQFLPSKVRVENIK